MSDPIYFFHLFFLFFIPFIFYFYAGIAVVGLGLLGKQVFDYPKHILYNDAALVFALALSGGLVLLALRLGEPNRHAPPSMIGVSLYAAMALLGLLLLVLGYARY
ncbi:MAG: hypothetical protein WBX11_08200 [Thiobacillaceae bacterium]